MVLCFFSKRGGTDRPCEVLGDVSTKELEAGNFLNGIAICVAKEVSAISGSPKLCNEVFCLLSVQGQIAGRASARQFVHLLFVC